MFRQLTLGAALVSALTLPALAQDAAVTEVTPVEAAGAVDAAPADPATLADLRADLTTLSAELKSLRAELNASGAKGFAAAGGDSAIDRMNAMERQLSRLTGETERLKNRIDRIVRDGTNRIGDIEFRLCEMEEGCDLGALTTPSLGDQGGAAPSEPALIPANLPQPSPDLPLTVEEKRAFDAASGAMQSGDFTRAAQLFADFARAHAGSPAAAEAQYLRGAALDNAGDGKGATAAWLSTFAAEPGGPRAADALLGLARIAAAGKSPEAGCLYLGELITRFGGSAQALEAEKLSLSSGCVPAAGDEPPVGDPSAGDDPEAAADLADGG